MSICHSCYKDVGATYASVKGEDARCLPCIEKDGTRIVCCEGCGVEDERRELNELGNSLYCDGCYEEAVDGMHENEAAGWHGDPHGDFDPTPEEQAGWAFEDKLEMYRNEY